MQIGSNHSENLRNLERGIIFKDKLSFKNCKILGGKSPNVLSYSSKKILVSKSHVTREGYQYTMLKFPGTVNHTMPLKFL